MPNKVKLKKYANRRLYDMEKSTYVTLNQVADLIREGRQVEVIDAKTKEDVTAFTLNQIILEEAKNKNFLLPIPVLHLIIQYGDNILGDFFEKYFHQMITTYLAHKNAMDEQFKNWLEMGLDYSKMAQKTMTDFPPFKSFLDQFSAMADKEKKTTK
jgi:polyhydroxyalkanoate synthesis repressor PhaR